MSNKNFGDTTLGEGIALAIVILAICIGFGSCSRMVSEGINIERHAAKEAQDGGR